MSTRKGTAVFLSDVLDEAKQRMAEMQAKDRNTRATSEDATDVLATTAVLVNDLKRKRTKDYEFNWEQALSTTGDTGVKLQYTHCRLTSLLDSNPKGINSQDIEEAIEREELKTLLTHLSEPSAISVLYHMARFEEIIRDAYVDVEPCIIVQHLFVLCNDVASALKALPVQKAESREIALARLLLFASARKCLADGMDILGLTPLNQM